MELYPKYIVEDDTLVFSKARYHKELAIDKTKVKGGGWFKYISKTKTFEFSLDSHDFGRASLEEVQACFKAKQVFGSELRIDDISEKFNFIYISEDGTKIQLNESL